VYSASDNLVFGCWLTAASRTLLPTGPTDIVGCITVDEGDDVEGFERWGAVVSGAGGKGRFAPNEGYLFSEVEDDDRLFRTENDLSFSCLESRTSHTVDEDDGIRDFETCEAAVSTADDTTGLAPDERYAFSAADDNGRVLRTVVLPFSESRTSQGLRFPPWSFDGAEENLSF
jgi:hypothetical protein